MRFLKYYTPLMVKLLGNQIIISLLSNMLFGTLNQYPLLLTIGTVMALGVYFYMQHRVVWEHACAETLKHPELQMHLGPITGLLVGFGSGIPAFLINLVPVLFPMYVNELGNLSGGFSYLCYVLSKFLFNGQYVAILDSIFPTVVFDTKDAVLGAQNGANIIASIPFYLLTILPLALVCWFSYWLGLKDKTIPGWLGIEHLFRRQSKEKKKDSRPSIKK